MPPANPIDWASQRVVVTGGAGFLGTAVVRHLFARGLPAARLTVVRSRAHDLTTAHGASSLLRTCFGGDGPTCIIHCAGRVGGIQANRAEPGRFFHDNLAMTMHLAEQMLQAGLIERGCAFVQVGTMTSYPADAPTPYRETDLFRGYPDITAAPYGIAKLAAWQLLDAYHRQYGLKAAYLIPISLYGPGDNIADLERAHAAGSLVRRFVDAVHRGAAEVVCWGSGAPVREFLYIDDAADGLVAGAERALGGTGDPVPINLGSGPPVRIRELAELIGRLAGFSGSISWDIARPEGPANRSLDSSRAVELLGWRARTPLEQGLRRTIDWYRAILGSP